MRAAQLVGACYGVLVFAACGGDSKPGAATSVDGLIAAFAKAGLEPGELAPVEEKRLATKCRRGPVSGLEVTICEYDDATRAKKHEAAGLEVVGETTGAALAEGKLLLVVADRGGVDKDGKRIDKLTRAFRGK